MSSIFQKLANLSKGLPNIETPESSPEFKNTKNWIKEICGYLSTETKEYKWKVTVKSISDYLDESQKLERILYSEISNYIFGLDTSKRGIFSTNIDNLLSGVLSDTSGEITEDCRKIVVKIYDHFQLILGQIENIQKVFEVGIEESIEKAKGVLHEELRLVEKNHVSTLGIFAAIMLAFVGGITFSSSVLQNIDSVSVYRLYGVVVLLGFILINSLWLLIKFVVEINEKDTKVYNIKRFNITCCILMGCIFIAWLLNVQELSGYLYRCLPWCK